MGAGCNVTWPPFPFLWDILGPHKYEPTKMLILDSALIVVASILSTWAKNSHFFYTWCILFVSLWSMLYVKYGENSILFRKDLGISLAQPEAWLLCSWRVLDKINYGGRFSRWSISNNSVMLAVVHDQLNKQCNWQKAAYGFSLSCHRGDGSSAFYGDIFITNSSHLESSSYVFHT